MIQKPCLFCSLATQTPSHASIIKFKHCYTIADQYPVSPGHTLIIPYTHFEDWFSASWDVQKDIMQAIDSTRKGLDRMFAPDGYNIGMNCGSAAGQTIFHLHAHLIPRYYGDMEDPKGGVRGVIPDMQKY